ncbi:hypothetical protein SAMN04488061_1866 [Filomicrobium insigne]|uniref:Uncharacterized protein n=1 Tax=Filomicrobium insigne TaxID=418854 RepID=A0A1H0N2F6_9HYPH|nr:BrxE family protein [Filomicrobium insigne]SDO86914.1 hypothetical protein SAMN04488061_1866 [Filomicrobium insigne]
MTVPDQETELDYDWLLKLRVAVARCGEMDLAGWWNTSKQLGPSGSSVLKRGFPRTHHFAQARSVMAVASHRCEQLLSHNDAVTLWRLPEALEDHFESLWETWLERHAIWGSYFEAIAAIRTGDVIAAATDLGLVTSDDINALRALKAAPNGRGLNVGDSFTGQRRQIALLALGFSVGRANDPVVPFVQASAAA